MAFGQVWLVLPVSAFLTCKTPRGRIPIKKEKEQSASTYMSSLWEALANPVADCSDPKAKESPQPRHGRLLIFVPPSLLLPALNDMYVQACFRKALNHMDWRSLEYHTRVAETTALPCLDITGRPKTRAEPPCSSPLPSTGKAGLGKPSADTLLELGRFELLQNRSVRRALGLFKACLKESPWHASAKVGWEKIGLRNLWCNVKPQLVFAISNPRCTLKVIVASTGPGSESAFQPPIKA